MTKTTALRIADTANGQEDPQAGWIDLDSDDESERQWLLDHAGLGEAIKSRLLNPQRINRREHLEHGLFINFVGARAPETGSSQSLRIFIDEQRVWTVRSGRLALFDELRAQLAAGAGPTSPLDLVAQIALALAEHSDEEINGILADTDQLDERMLDRSDETTMRQLSALRRRIVRERPRLLRLRNVLQLTLSDPSLVLSKAERRSLVKATDHVALHLESLDDCRARTQLLQDQIEGRFAAEMARSSYKLTIVATVFLPLTFVTGLLGMNVAGIPESHNPWGFWLVCAFVFGIGMAFWVWLSWRGPR